MLHMEFQEHSPHRESTSYWERFCGLTAAIIPEQKARNELPRKRNHEGNWSISRLGLRMLRGDRGVLTGQAVPAQLRDLPFA